MQKNQVRDCCVKSIQDSNPSAPVVRLALVTYNRCELLGRMINSIRRQVYREFQVRVFDNGSLDGTQEMILTLVDEDSRFALDSVTENLGGYFNFQRAKQWAEDGEFFAILHDDDELDEQWLAATVAILNQNKDVGFAATNAKYLMGLEPILGKTTYLQTKGFKVFNEHKKFFFWLIFNSHLVFPSILYRASVTKTVPLLDVGRAADLIWYISVAKKTNVAICFQPLIHYRFHGQQDSMNLSEGDFMALQLNIEAHVRSMGCIFKYLARCWLSNHRLSVLRNCSKDKSISERAIVIFKEITRRKIVLFSPVVRYYPRLFRYILAG